MTITVSIPDEIARQAQAAGLPLESYVERLLEQQAQRPEELREARKAVTLGGRGRAQ